MKASFAAPVMPKKSGPARFFVRSACSSVVNRKEHRDRRE
jgi:hypothetical protein